MPSLQSIVLTDRTTPTPVAHTFTPKGVANGVGIVSDRTGGVPFGEPRLSVSLREATDRYHAELRFSVPVMATELVNGVSRPIVLRTSYVTLKASFPRSSTEQERDDVIGMFADALDPSKTLVNDTLVKLEGVYGA